MYLNGNNYELVGVVSFGIGCGKAPAVYAKVRGKEFVFANTRYVSQRISFFSEIESWWKPIIGDEEFPRE